MGSETPVLDKRMLVDAEITVMQALKRLDQTAQKVLFVVDRDQRLKGSLTDGDIRRHLLEGGSLDDQISNCFNKSPKVINEQDYSAEAARRMMSKNKITMVPVLDRKGVIVDVASGESVVQNGRVKHPARRQKLHVPVVIMAGGKGTRLDPFTRILPKPLIPIGDKPVIQMIVDKFVEYGVKDFYISVNHKAGMIKAFFDSVKTNYNITFLEEEYPRGTAGSLGLLRSKMHGTFILSNSDAIIEEDYSRIVRYHEEQGNDITVVMSAKNFTIPYGVCEMIKGGTLISIREKPELGYLVSTGFYIVDPRVLHTIPKSGIYHFTQLIKDIRKGGGKVGGFPISEKSWVDIGEWDAYKAALNYFKL